MQGFNWESWNKQGSWYNVLKGQVADIASAGVTHVWLPPPSHSVSPQGNPSCHYVHFLSASASHVLLCFDAPLRSLRTAS